jgi:spore coat protein U-like protein
MFSRARIVTLVLLAAGVVLASASSAQAQGPSPQTAPMQVTANVVTRCTVSAAPLAFGDYNTFSAAPLDALTNLALRCTRGAVTTITLNDGVNGVRNMAGPGSALLPYSLYSDSRRTTAWPAAGMAWTAPDRTSHNIPVYGRIAADIDVPPGAYADTVTVTVSF